MFFRNCLLEDMNHFYEHDYGEEWTVPDTRYCLPGRCMAAMYQDIGYHRVLIKKILSKKRVSVLYLNSGTEIDISVKNLRLLHKKFLALPAQAIKARLFGVTEIKIEELTALVSSQNMHGLFCTILKQEDSKLDVPVVKLNDWLSEVSIECKLTNENCSAPLIKDLVDYMKQLH